MVTDITRSVRTLALFVACALVYVEGISDLKANAARDSTPFEKVAGPLLKYSEPPKAIEAIIAARLKEADAQPRLYRLNDLASGNGAPRGQIIFHNNRIAIALLDEKDGLGITNIFHIARGVGFGAKPKEGYRGLIWRLSLRTDRGGGEQLALTNRSPSQRGVRLDEDTDSAVLRLSWKDLDVGDEKSALDVSVSILLRRDSPRSEWRVDVDNRSREWSLWEVYFPELDLGHIGESPADDFLVIPRAEGRCHKNPIHGWRRGFMTGACQPYGHGYPGGAQMQFAAYYEKDGDYLSSSERRSGLYLATEDGELNVKKFFYTNLPQLDTLCYEVLHFPPDMVTPGGDYRMPYRFVASAFDGDWFDAAKIYRRWALRQKWCRRGPFVGRDDIPQWFKEADYFFRADSRKGATKPFREMCEDALKTLGAPVCCQWYNWQPQSIEKGHDPLSYFPPLPGIAEAWRDARKRNIHIFPYVNAQIWDTRAPSYQQALPYAIKDEHGDVVNWSSKDYANMCRTQGWYQQLIADACRELVKKYEAGGLYLDQLGSAFNGLCLDPTHGHPLGGGSHAVAGARRIFELVRERVGADIPVISEASSEENIDISAGKIIHYNLWPGFVPLFSAAYHDMWSFYGRNVGGPKGDPQGFMNIGNCFIIGGQVGRIWPGRIPNALKGTGEPWVLEQSLFLKKVIEARRKAAKFLRYGEMLRPLEIVGRMPSAETRLWRAYNKVAAVPAVLPAVLSSVWKAPDGDVGFAFANVSDETVDAVFQFELAEYGLPSKGELHLRAIVGGAGTITVRDGCAKYRLRLEAHEVCVSGL